MTRLFLSAILVAAQFSPVYANACSAFAGSSANSDYMIVGKSYDWLLSHGIALINKRNVGKASMLTHAGDAPIRWVSKYGSLTYTQFGREFPVSGLNEKGLAIEVLWDYDNPGPSPKGNRPIINEAQWVQYQLDISATVDEVIANSKGVQIRKAYANVHYLVCDKSGACATFEFRGDQVLINKSGAEGIRVLTNSDYAASKKYLGQFMGFGGKQKIPVGSYKSMDRFVILSSHLNELNTQNSLEKGLSTSFNMLRSVRNSATSVWNLTHDLRGGVSHFKRMFHERLTMITDLNHFDLSCKTPVKILDLESALDGDVSARYGNYDPALNRATVEESGRGLKIDRALVEAAIAYPETTFCTEN